jgi:hypothetical protein
MTAFARALHSLAARFVGAVVAGALLLFAAEMAWVGGVYAATHLDGQGFRLLAAAVGAVVSMVFAVWAGVLLRVRRDNRKT